MTLISPDKKIKLQYSDEEIISFIADFRQVFPNEESLARLINELYNLGIFSACLACGNENIEVLRDARLIRCIDCSAERWLTSGTFFHGAKKLFPWVLDIWLKANGIFLASSRFHKLVGVAQSTALQISKRIAMVISSTYEEDSPEISTSFFIELFSRRSTESIAQQHPRSEQAAIDKSLQDSAIEENEENSLVDVQANNMTESQREVFELILFEQINSDDIMERLPHRNFSEVAAALTMLELSGHIQRFSGDNYVRVRTASGIKHALSSLVTDETVNSFESIKYAVKTLFHSVSRKHIQHYVAKFWCLFQTEKWKGHELLHACAAYRHITEREITASVTPPYMKIPAQCLQLTEHSYV